MVFDTVSALVAELKLGRMILVVDDEHRENEGDLVLAADFVSPEKINFMITQARGLVCLSMTPQLIDQLNLPLMVPFDENGAPNKTAFTVSIEAAHGISTGISAADRSHTIHVASRPNARPSEISRPGHIFPLRARAGGVLERPGHTEASVDFVKIAGLNPAAVICEVMNDDGTMARLPDLVRFAQKHQLKIGTIHDLIEYFREEKRGQNQSEIKKNSGIEKENKNWNRDQSL
jgi:3,4-dihydroxy 2-butanone 4-phosphate synthase / GTP cyclohydrolase II